MKTLAKYFLRGIMLLFGILPLKVHHFNARIIAWLLRSVARYRVDDVMINLSRSFPDKSYSELKTIRNDFYLHLADVFVEALWFGARNVGQLHRSGIVRIKNPEEAARLLKDSPGVICLNTHCGNFELFGGICAYDYTFDSPVLNESNFCISYLAQPGEVWNSVLEANRKAPVVDKKNYDGYLESRELLRFILRHENERRFFSVITDQRPYFYSPSFMHVNFMHQDCVSMYAGAAIACKRSFAVCYCKMTVEGRGKYALEYIPICDDASTMDKEIIMKRYYELLEEQLNEQPFNYLWTHRRWLKID